MVGAGLLPQQEQTQKGEQKSVEGVSGDCLSIRDWYVPLPPSSPNPAKSEQGWTASKSRYAKKNKEKIRMNSL